MVSFDKRFSVLTVQENWFDMKYRSMDLFKLTAFYHVLDPGKKLPFGVKEISYTVENDLTIAKEKIHGNLSKAYRQQIRKAEEEGMECVYHDDIDGFVKFFNEFAASKKINLTSRRRIEEIGDRLKLGYVKLNGVILAAHSHLVDEELAIVRAYHSATQRLSAEFDRNQVGRANKLLHYKDMLHFKDLGFKIYDFGGYDNNSSDKSLQGINEFKLNFGGKVVHCTNYSTVPYYLLRKTADALGLI